MPPVATSTPALTRDPPGGAFEQAMALHQAGQLLDAAAVYQGVLADDPAHGPALHMAGMLALQLGQEPLGLARLELAFAGGYRTAPFLDHYGVVRQRRGELALAIACFREGLDLDPASGSLWFNLGVAERQSGRLPLAIAAFSRAAPLLRQGFAERAHGLALQEAGHCAEAAVAYARAMALDPADAESALNAGVIAQQAGDAESAAAFYRQALAIQPNLLGARINLASVLQDSGDLPGAAAEYRAILADAPDATDALNNLGTTLRRLGDIAHAEQLFRRVLVLDPFHAEACDNLVELLADDGRGAHAIDVLQSRCAAHPAEARCWLDLARVLLAGAGKDQAEPALHAALARDPALAEAHCRLGDCAHARRDWDLAASCYRRAAQLAPDRPEPHLGLALVALKSGNGPAALTACDTVLARDRFDQGAIAYRILALRQCGRQSEAAWLSDPGALVAVLSLDVGAAALAALAEDLRTIRNRKFAPSGQSIRGGTQTTNELFAEAAGSIQDFRCILDAAITHYLARREPSDAHPFLAARPERLHYHSWSVVLQAGGHHVPHIHPGGCISGVFYVAVQDLADGGEGCLEIGRPGFSLPLPQEPPHRLIQPVPGRLVLFPSYLWHGTTPFRGAGDRITIAFDVRYGAKPLPSNRWQ